MRRLTVRDVVSSGMVAGTVVEVVGPFNVVLWCLWNATFTVWMLLRQSARMRLPQVSAKFDCLSFHFACENVKGAGQTSKLQA